MSISRLPATPFKLKEKEFTLLVTSIKAGRAIGFVFKTSAAKTKQEFNVHHREKGIELQKFGMFHFNRHRLLADGEIAIIRALPNGEPT